MRRFLGVCCVLADACILVCGRAYILRYWPQYRWCWSYYFLVVWTKERRSKTGSTSATETLEVNTYTGGEKSSSALTWSVRGSQGCRSWPYSCAQESPLLFSSDNRGVFRVIKRASLCPFLPKTCFGIKYLETVGLCFFYQNKSYIDKTLQDVVFMYTWNEVF